MKLPRLGVSRGHRLQIAAERQWRMQNGRRERSKHFYVKEAAVAASYVHDHYYRYRHRVQKKEIQFVDAKQ